MGEKSQKLKVKNSKFIFRAVLIITGNYRRYKLKENDPVGIEPNFIV
jgi:hypothetical protein